MKHTSGTFILEKWLELSPVPVRDIETFHSYDLAKAAYYSNKAANKSPLVTYRVSRVDSDGIRVQVLPVLLGNFE